MPISLDSKRGLTKRQSELAGRIAKLKEEGKTNKTIAEEIGIGISYVADLKIRAGLTKKKVSEVREWIEEHKEVKDWLREIKGGDASNNTKIQFATFLRRYCIFRDLTPGELLDEGESDLKRERRDKVVKNHLLDFKDNLRERSLSNNSIAGYFSAIRSFFNSHDVLLPKLSNSKREIINKKKEFDVEKVRALISACSPIEKAIFLVMFQSGLAANEVSGLKIKDLLEEKKEGIVVLRLRREKSKVNFVTFLAKDAQKAIKDYLKIRNEGNLLYSKPNISKLAKVKDKNDYLFVTYNSHKREWNRIHSGHISRYMLNICRRLGWIGEEKINPHRPHALRASFATILTNNGVPKYFVDYMLGHTSTLVDKAYFNVHFDKLFAYYKHNEDLLSISELDKIPDSRYEELKLEIHEKDELLTIFENRLKELESDMEGMRESYEWKIDNPEKALRIEEIRKEYEKKYGKDLNPQQLKERSIEIMKMVYQS